MQDNACTTVGYMSCRVLYFKPVANPVSTAAAACRFCSCRTCIHLLHPAPVQRFPQVAALIHSAVTTVGCAPLAGDDLAAVAEGLKVLLLLSTLMAAKGEAAQVRLVSGPRFMPWHAPCPTHRVSCVQPD